MANHRFITKPVFAINFDAIHIDGSVITDHSLKEKTLSLKMEGFEWSAKLPLLCQLLMEGLKQKGYNLKQLLSMIALNLRRMF